MPRSKKEKGKSKVVLSNASQKTDWKALDYLFYLNESVKILSDVRKEKNKDQLKKIFRECYEFYQRWYDSLKTVDLKKLSVEQASNFDIFKSQIEQGYLELLDIGKEHRYISQHRFYRENLRHAQRLMRTFNYDMQKYTHKISSVDNISKTFKSNYEFHRDWIYRLEKVDTSKFHSADKQTYLTFKSAIETGYSDLHDKGKQFGFTTSNRNLHRNLPGLLFDRPSARKLEPQPKNPQLMRRDAIFLDIGKITSNRRKRFHEKSEIEKKLPPPKKSPKNITYAELNKIYKESVELRVKKYKTTVGGVEVPWHNLPELKDSKSFAEFESPRAKDDGLYMESSWKIHMSIQPEDLGKAWDLVYPILMREQVPHFKVTRIAVTKKQSEAILAADPEMLKKKHIYDEHIKQALYDNKRVSEGMQITVYIPKGEEKKYNDMLKEIEPVLCDVGVKPGIVDKSDRAIGVYSSVRHVGKGYATHDLVKAYKEVSEVDPFEEIPLDWSKVSKIDFKKLDVDSQLERAREYLVACKKIQKEYLECSNPTDKPEIRKRYSQMRHVAYEFHKRWHDIIMAILRTHKQPYPPELQAFKGQIDIGLSKLIGVRVISSREGMFDEAAVKKEVKEALALSRSSDITPPARHKKSASSASAAAPNLSQSGADKPQRRHKK